MAHVAVEVARLGPLRVQGVPGVSFLGETIKAGRAARSMSLQAVADAAGLTKTHVWQLEQGSCNNPTVKSLLGVATALRLDPEVLACLAMADCKGA